MTEPKPPPVRVAADAGSRLAQLHAERNALAPAVKAGTERLKELNDAIKVELVTAQPDAGELVLTTPGIDKPLRLAWVARKQFREAAFKAAHPALAAQFTDDHAGSWVLKEGK